MISGGGGCGMIRGGGFVLVGGGGGGGGGGSRVDTYIRLSVCACMHLVHPPAGAGR